MAILVFVYGINFQRCVESRLTTSISRMFSKKHINPAAHTYK